jgi:aspartate racemase
MGPKSTGPFIDLVVKECQRQYGAKYDIDFPAMMIYSLPTPFFVDRPIDHTEMKRVVIAGVKKLEEIGCRFIAIPCNTVHAYFEELKASTGVPLLNIVHETMSQLRGGKKIAVLATRPTIEAKVYQRGIESMAASVFWSEELQQALDGLLLKVKGSAPGAISAWQGLLNDIVRANCDAVVVACTDLSLLPFEYEGLRIVDSSKSLAAAVVREYLECGAIMKLA